MSDYQPGARVRLLRPLGSYPAGEEGTVIELRASLMNGFEVAVQFDGFSAVLLFNSHELERVERPTNSALVLQAGEHGGVNLRRAGGLPPEAAARRSNDERGQR